MHDFWTITTSNMMYGTLYILQNSINIMAVNKHGIQTFEVVIDVFLPSLLCFHVFVLTSTHTLLILDKWFNQIYLKC